MMSGIQKSGNSVWGQSLASETAELIAQIPENRANRTEQIKNALDELCSRLNMIEAAEAFDPKSVKQMVHKKDYVIVAKIETPEVVDRLGQLPTGEIVSGGWNGRIDIWRASAEGYWSEALRGPPVPIRGMQVLPDGSMLWLNHKGIIGIWNPRAREDRQEIILPFRFPKGLAVCMQAISRECIVFGLDNGEIHIYSQHTSKEWSSEVLKTHTERVTSLHVMPNGKILSGSVDGSVRLWSKSLDSVWSSSGFEAGEGPVHCVQGFADGRMLLAYKSGVVLLTPPDGAGGEPEIVRRDQKAVVYAQALTDDRIVSGGFANRLSMSSKVNGKWETETFNKKTGRTYVIKALQDGRILSAGTRGTIYVWDGVAVK